MVFTDDTVAVANKKNKKIEGLRLERNRLAAAAKLPPLDVWQMLAEPEGRR
jgi:hypothetical protein